MKILLTSSFTKCKCIAYIISGFDTSLGKLSSSHAESGFASMHSLRSSSHSYTSSQQISSRSSQQSAVSYMSTESTSSKFRQVQCTTTESSVTMMQTQRTVSSETPLYHTEHSVNTDVARSISPDGDSVLNIPPALPQKTQSKQRRDRQLSTYDNVPSDATDELHSSSHQEQHILSCSMHQSKTLQHSSCRSPDGKPPPLPPKKKHSECYLTLFVCVKCEV
jgi:hypothetical protein